MQCALVCASVRRSLIWLYTALPPGEKFEDSASFLQFSRALCVCVRVRVRSHMWPTMAWHDGQSESTTDSQS